MSGVDDLDLDGLSGEEIDQLATETGAEAAPGAGDADLDAELVKMGYKTPLPDGTPREAKQALIDRVKEYQRGITPQLQRASNLEKELAKAQGKLEALEAKSVKTDGSDPEVEARRAAAEAKVFELFDKWYGERVKPTVDWLTEQYGHSQLKSMREKHGQEWTDLEDQIIAAKREHPTLTIEQAFNLARSATADVRAEKRILDKIAEKRKAAGAAKESRGGSQSKAFDLANTRELSDDEAFEAAYNAAKEAARNSTVK